MGMQCNAHCKIIISSQVGVGGYLLGGGVNVIGTSQRLTSGANNVLQYTVVDAEGDTYKVK